MKNENDPRAREALWKAIIIAIERLAGHCSIYKSGSQSNKERISANTNISAIENWKLMEALSFLSILLHADEIKTPMIENLFGKMGPIHIIEEKKARFIWTQLTLFGEKSELGGRPDILVTSSSEKPTSETVLRVIEAKCRKSLSAPDIRAEFGKAFDLKVESYLIWSFSTPPAYLIEGAKRLGLELAALGFDTARREELISNPENLLSHVANTLNFSRQERLFAKTIIITGQEMGLKLLDK
jgi:hypothetical protein